MKILALIRSMKFLSPEIAFYLNKSTVWPCMKYCCHAWAGFYLDMLDMLQNRICMTAGPTLAASLERFGHCRNIASLKVLSTTFLLVCFLSLNDSTCQTRKNNFYFTSKALFILEKI